MLAARVEQKNGTYVHNIQTDIQSSPHPTGVAMFGINPVTLGTIFEAIYPIFWSRFLLIPDSCPSSKMPNNRSTPVVNKEIRDGQAEFYTRNMMREAQ